jgi:hypothetical protein
MLDEVRGVLVTRVVSDRGGARGRRVQCSEEQQGADRTRDEKARGRVECDRASSEMRALHASGNSTEPGRFANRFGVTIA